MTDALVQQLINNRRKDLESQFAGNIEKSTDVGKDVLSIVLKANMSKDARDDLKLRDSELQPQIVTFILAGSETSSTVLAWLLWRLAHNQDVQDRLRAELQTLDVEQPELEQLNSLPYLENVVREGELAIQGRHTRLAADDRSPHGQRRPRYRSRSDQGHCYTPWHPDARH